MADPTNSICTKLQIIGTCNFCGKDFMPIRNQSFTQQPIFFLLDQDNMKIILQGTLYTSFLQSLDPIGPVDLEKMITI